MAEAYFGYLHLENVDFIQKQDDGRPQEPSRVDNGLE